MDKNLQHIIDKRAYELLKDSEVPFNPEHWSKMEQRLIELDTEDTSFDESLRQTIEKSISAYQPQHWDLMNQKLNELDAQDTVFDNAIRQTLEESEPAFKPQHWDLMNRQLEQEFSWKAKIVRYKVIETALMLLLLFTAYNILDTEGGSIEQNQEVKSLKSNGTKSFNQDAEWRTKGQKQQNNTQPSVIKNAPIVSADLNRTTDSSVKENKLTSANVYQNRGVENSLNSEDVTYAPVNSLENTLNTIGGNQSEEIKSMDVISALPVLQTNSLAFNETKGTLNIKKKSPVNESIVPTDRVVVMSPKSLTINALYDEPILPKMAKKNKWWRLGIFGGGTADYVTSSYLHQGTLTEWANLSTNKGAGFSIGRKRGRIELEVGLAYNKKNYKTALPEEIITGSVVTGKSNRTALPEMVNLDIVRVPFSINYAFKEMGRWQLFASLGTSFNAATKIDIQHYEVKDATAFKAQSLNLRSSSSLPEYGERFKIGLEKNVDNFYFSALAGVGIEYKLTPSISTYFQPTLEKQFGKYGIGSRNDKVNSLNIQAGLKMRITKEKF